MMVMMMLMIVIVAAAGAAFAMLMMVIMVMPVMLMLVIIIIVIVMMLVVMIVAGAMLVMVMMVVMLMIVIVIIVVVIFVQVQLDGLAGLDDLQHGVGGQIIPGGGDDAAAGMLLLHQGAGLLHPLGGQQLGAAEDDGVGGLDLVEEELAEVLHVHAAFARVHHGGAAGNGHLVPLGGALYRSEDVAELAHAGGLDDQAVGVILLNQLVHRLLEVAHQGAADAAAVHFGDGDARVLHKAAVHADLAVFVFQQDDLFLPDLAAQELLDERGLARAQETGNDVNLDHGVFASFLA